MATRVWARVGAGLVAAAALVPLLPSTGQAETISQVQAQIAAARAQLHAMDVQIERATQAYDAGQLELQAAAAQAAAAQAGAARAQRRVAGMTAAMEAFATAAYQGAALSSFAILTQGGAQGFLDRAASLQALSAREESLLGSYRAAQEGAQAATAAAGQALAAQRKATARLAADKQAILSSVGKERALLSGLQAQEAHLVAQAQAQARAAAQAAARAAAARLAAQARAEAAALAAQAAETAAAQSSFSSQPVSPAPAPGTPADQGGGSGGAPGAVQWAYRGLGKPYQWGAAGPDSFDCSGLTQYVWGKAGVYLAHYTGDQWNEGTHVTNLQPGDLVFFGSDHYHVGIYVGNGEMIDAPHSGANVREEPLWGDYSGAVRP